MGNKLSCSSNDKNHKCDTVFIGYSKEDLKFRVAVLQTKTNKKCLNFYYQDIKSSLDKLKLLYFTFPKGYELIAAFLTLDQKSKLYNALIDMPKINPQFIEDLSLLDQSMMKKTMSQVQAVENLHKKMYDKSKAWNEAFVKEVLEQQESSQGNFK